MENLTVKRKPTINLSLFTTLSGSFSSDVNKSPNSANKSFRNFQDGVVGLGIVAAMTDLTNKTCEANLMVVSPRSTPVPIVSSAKAAANFRGGGLSDMERDGEVDEFSESYTCVISHLGNNLIEKRVYYDDMVNGVDDDYCSSCVVTGIDVGLFSASPVNLGEARREFEASDFLSSCYLCNKKLHGLDIFMYRGEKAFCSSECRDKQIRSDDYKEKCGSKALKPIDYSVSPCSTSPLVFFAGVAAA